MKHLLALTILLAPTLASCQTNKRVDYLVTIETPHGTMKAVLYDDAPEHKENFFELVEAGRLDSTIFHRVIENFMIQGGDVDLKEGKGAIDYTIPYENEPHLVHRKGALAAARQGDQMNPERESSGCQFYIVHGAEIASEADLGRMLNGQILMRMIPRVGEHVEMQEFKAKYQELYAARDAQGLNELVWSHRQKIAELGNFNLAEPSPVQVEAYAGSRGTPHLDDGYSVFGQVVEGLEVIDKIAAVPTGQADKPIEDVPMTLSLEKVKRKKLAALYGEDYTRGNRLP